jgi:4-amino-4-deoxy-L-arabinose transferase-like glycosyltransferase
VTQTARAAMAEERTDTTGDDQTSTWRRPTRGFVIGLAIIGAIALAIRIWWVLVGYGNYKIGGDSYYYHLTGWSLADGHGFINPLDYYLHGGKVTPSAANPPLYGMYLGVVSFFGGWSVTAHRLASTLLGTGAVVLIGIVGRQIANERTGLIAAGIAAVYANLWINDGMLLPEPMAALTMVLVLVAAYAFWKRPRWGTAIWLGLALGAAALSRGEVVFLAPLLTLPLVWGMRQFSWRRRIEFLATAAVAMIVLVGPWVGYNMSRFKDPVFMTDHWGTVLENASCHDTYFGQFRGWYQLCDLHHYPGDASQEDTVLRKEALRYMRAHLGALPGVMGARVGRLWDVYKPSQTLFLNSVLEGRTKKASRLALWQYYVLMPPALAGLVVLRRRRVPIMPLIAPAIVVTIAAALTYGVLRYRVTVEPGIVLAAAVSIDVVWTSVSNRRRARRSGASDPKAPVASA